MTEREWKKLIGMTNAIDDFDPFYIINYDRLKKTLLEGVPDDLRGEIWCLLCQVKREKSMHSENIYGKLLTLENPD